MGTQGTLVSRDRRELRWKYFDPAEAPPLVLDTKPTPDRGYNSETLPWKRSPAPSTSTLAKAWSRSTTTFTPPSARARRWPSRPPACAASGILERCREIVRFKRCVGA
ncbi:MAG: hypothetical protein R2911_35815 [Caldilineaceae bacterium]